MSHIEADIEAAEKELDDDAESIITPTSATSSARLIKRCYKKHSAGKLTTSDKIDKIVTNRWLGLPIFAVVMFLVYYIAMVGVGAAATDWANDGLFGDGWHLFGIGSADYNEDADAYNEASLIVDGYDAYVEENGTAPTGDFPYEVEDEETLEITEETASLADYEEALKTLEGEEPDPANYGVWVPGIPVLIGDLLEKANAAEWLSGLILDGIVAGVGAVLGFRCWCCSCCWPFWKPAATWPVSHSFSTVSSGNSACPVSPLSPCWSAPAAAFPASWRPVPLKTSVTAG